MDINIHEALRTNYLFKAFDDAQLDTMARATRQVSLETGERLFTQGDPIRAFYFVVRGQIKLYRLSKTGYEKIIDLVNVEETFAEAVMFMNDEGYPVNAEALKSSILLAFDAPTFIQLLRESNETCFRLMANMSQRLRWQLNEIDRLTLHTASFRFISFLLDPPPRCQGENGEVRLNMPKHVLASRLSIKPETFSRLLARLSDEGLIEAKRDAVLLRDVQGLRERLQNLL